MDVVETPVVPKTDNFVDDDELQASLARARRAKTKKFKGPTQEEIAQRRTFFDFVQMQFISLTVAVVIQLPKNEIGRSVMVNPAWLR